MAKLHAGVYDQKTPLQTNSRQDTFADMFGTSEQSQSTSFFSEQEGINAIKAGSAALKIAGGLSSLQTTLSNADSQISAIDLSIGENRRRHSTALKNLRRRASKTQASQREQFASAGVKLEGSALDVTTETFYDMLEAQIEQDRQLAFQEEQQRVQQANLGSAKDAAKMKFAFDSATTLLGGFSG